MNLTKENVRLANSSPFATHYNWPLLDPWLMALRKRGSVNQLARLIGVPAQRLAERRTKIGAPRIPEGRTVVTRLTFLEDLILRKLTQGMTDRNIARDLGWSIQKFDLIFRRALLKMRLHQPCAACFDLGIKECFDCQMGTTIHFHICETCGCVENKPNYGIEDYDATTYRKQTGRRVDSPAKSHQ